MSDSQHRTLNESFLRNVPPSADRRGRRVVPATVQSLESRTLLAFAPVGPEFRVNTFTASDQMSPAVASDADGDSVVAWESYGQDGSDKGIFAQRYDSAGVPRGQEFRVNDYTAQRQAHPSVAMDAAGDFVVAWQSLGQDGSGEGVYARRYSAAGEASGGEFRVNTSTLNNQAEPAVAMDDAGNFAITWTTFRYNSFVPVKDLFMQRYDAAGVPLGSRVFVAGVGPIVAGTPAVNPHMAMGANGDIVVAWCSWGLGGLYVRLFDATGAAKGAPFPVTTAFASLSSVATDPAGAFTVAWGDATSGDVFAQRYDAVGVAQAAAFRVNSTTKGLQTQPSAAMDAQGNLLVAWASFAQDGSDLGVYSRRYSAAGVPQGAEARVNTFTTGAQQAPAAAMSDDGHSVIAWQSAGQDGSGSGIYAQRYATGPAPIPAPARARPLARAAYFDAQFFSDQPVIA